MRIELLLAALSLVASSQASHLTDALLSRVYDKMVEFSEYSWENGTKAQAILEWTYPDLSIFSTASSSNPFPTSLSTNQIPQIMEIAQTTMRNRPPTNSSGINGGSTLLEDGAAADPASLGIAILLANVSTGNGQINGVGYGDAARSQTNYLLYNVPRSTTGAISHRRDQSQYWSDFMFMVPPYLATYAVYTSNSTVMQIAYDQSRLYRDFLKRSNGLWAHIQGGNGSLDPGLWATGNAWAAYGMLRVWATMNKSPYKGSFGAQMGDLVNWIGEIMGACNSAVTPNNLLRNYVNDTSSFEETSASALIAATGLRLSVLGITDNYIPLSLKLLSAVSGKVAQTGVLQQVVDPLDWSKQGTDSPEGQSFTIMAYAAHGDWVKAGKKGSPDGSDGLGNYSAAGRRMGQVGMGLGLVGVIGGAVVMGLLSLI